MVTLMTTEDVVMTIEKPHFTVKLHKTLLQLHLKTGIKKELEDFLESKATLRDSLGFLFQTIIPLDVRLKDIESVNVEKKGQIKIAIPLRKDIVIPLELNESKRLVKKMKELILIEKDRVIKELEEAKRARKMIEPEIAEAEEEALRDRAREE